MRCFAIIAVLAGSAVADPAPPAPTKPVNINLDVNSQPLVLRPLTLFDVPAALPAPSLRLEAARIAAERYQDNWRNPDPVIVGGLDAKGWFYGAGQYRPRSRRAAALHGGSMGATLLGEILLATGSPLAGVAALATGATLDAAAADSDRDAEARTKRDR